MMSGLVSGDSVTRIKGGKMRVDGTVGDSPTSTLIDLDAQRMSALNHKAKEATVTDLRELQATMRKLTDNSVKATVTPTAPGSGWTGLRRVPDRHDRPRHGSSPPRP
jgi:hypothetical protein